MHQFGVSILSHNSNLDCLLSGVDIDACGPLSICYVNVF